jgi:hypothetical protein
MVARAVRRLDMRVVYEVMHDRPERYQDCNLIMDAVFECLPYFVNLTVISCEDLRCTGQQLINLCNLERLRELVFTNCQLWLPIDESVVCRVSSLIITSLRVFPIDEWMTFFHSDSVSIRIGHTSLRTLGHLAGFPSTRRYMQSLSSLICYPEELPVLEEVLSQLPRLRFLHLTFTPNLVRDNIEAISFPALPHLHTFQGPYELLCALSAVEPLHQLRYVDLSTAFNTAYHVKDAIIGLGEQAGQLERLRFSVDYLTHGLLETLVDLCGGLKTLSIKILGLASRDDLDPDTYIQVSITAPHPLHRSLNLCLRYTCRVIFRH